MIISFLWKPAPKGSKVDPKKVQTITESSRSLEIPGTSQLPQPLQSKVSRGDNTTENTQQEGHSLHLGKFTTRSIWGNLGGDHICTHLSIFRQVNTKHHTVTWSKNGPGAVLLQDGKSVIYVSRSLTETEKQYSNIERKPLSVYLHLGDFITMSTATQRQSKLASSHHMKEEIASSLPHLKTLFPQLSQYDVNIEYLKGRRMSLQIHFLEFHPCQSPNRWIPEGHHCCPHAHKRTSNWFYKCGHNSE